MLHATLASNARQLPLFTVPLARDELARESARRETPTLEHVLGAHRPHWLALSDVPLFVSHRRLGPRKSLPRAKTRWALDSGGFSELKLFGGWRTTPRAYAHAVRRYRDEIGGLVFASQQDFMCEPLGQRS